MTEPIDGTIDGSSFKLDRAGGAEVLKEMAAVVISALTDQIAAAAGPDAEVKKTVTDRARGTVTVPAEQQAKDGVLTKAAAAVGLEVHTYAQRARSKKRSKK